MAFGGGWNPIRIAGKSPLPRSGHVAVEYMGKIFVWGGSVDGKDSPIDLCVLNTGNSFLCVEFSLFLSFSLFFSLFLFFFFLSLFFLFFSLFFFFFISLFSSTFLLFQPLPFFSLTIPSPAGLKSWNQPKTTGRPPTARHGHKMVLGDKKLYLFGGKGASYFNDMYIMNCATLAWQKPRITGFFSSLFFFSISSFSFFLSFFSHSFFSSHSNSLQERPR